MTARESLIVSSSPSARAVGDRQCLHLWFPTTYDPAKRLLPHLERLAPQHVWDAKEGRLQVPLATLQVAPLIMRLGELLTTEETVDTKALLLAEHQAPAPSDIARVKLLSTLIVQQRAEWLRAILGQSRITCHFQPIVHAEDTSRILGYESLLRGVGEDGGLIAPGDLLDCSRRAGLLQSLDEQARHAALREFAKAKRPQLLFVNFSPVALVRSQAYLEATLQLVDALGLARDRLVFEIVEMDRIENMALFRQVLGRYREAGFRVALDDMGAGYSSLNLLHELRPEFLKIDMALVRGVHEDAFKSRITRQLLDLGRQLDILTIAEGVECERELAWLRASGAHYVQGYLIAKPANPPVVVTTALGR